MIFLCATHLIAPYTFNCTLHILVIQLAICRFFGHPIDHDIVDHSIGQSPLNHSIDSFQMPAITHSWAKSSVVSTELLVVPSHLSSQPKLDIISSTVSTAEHLSTMLVLGLVLSSIVTSAVVIQVQKT